MVDFRFHLVVVVWDERCRHVVSGHSALFGASFRQGVPEYELDPLSFDQFVGEAQRGRRLREDFRDGVLARSGPGQTESYLLKAWRQRHQSDEHEVDVEGCPLEELLEHLARN